MEINFKETSEAFKFTYDQNNLLQSVFQITDLEFKAMLRRDFGFVTAADRVGKTNMKNLLHAIKNNTYILNEEYAYEYEEGEMLSDGVTPAKDYTEDFTKFKNLVKELQELVGTAIKAKVDKERQADFSTLTLYLTDKTAVGLPFIMWVNDEMLYMRLTDAEHHITQQGEYIRVVCGVKIAKPGAITQGRYSFTISHYEGIKTLNQLGMKEPTSELLAQLIERGKKYVNLVSKPSYMEYSGTLVRRSFWQDQNFRSDGRVMVDHLTMTKIDPNYGYYFGVDRYADKENVKDLKFDHPFDDDTYALMIPFVYGFSFASKQWGEMSINRIQPVVFRDTAYDQLVLENSKKTMIKALVEHNDGGKDLINGKGGGLIFLLNGTPGVGKTLTAEAVAEKLHKPLYIVGAGELGVTPKELEHNLRNILDTANFWDAVLLIDEADIFLEARSNNDIVRNAMVGIFLRMLEYYQGILFLTTNRADSIDGAFFSRISLSIHYDSLTALSRAAIWNNILALYNITLTTEQLAELGQHDINGRQIKNCIRLANSLAVSRNEALTTEDILKVVGTITEFKEAIAKEEDTGLDMLKKIIKPETASV